MLLQLALNIRKIDSKCFQENRPAQKEGKDYKRIKSTDTSFANASSGKHQQSSVYQNQTDKKDQDHQ